MVIHVIDYLGFQLMRLFCLVSCKWKATLLKIAFFGFDIAALDQLSKLLIVQPDG